MTWEYIYMYINICMHAYRRNIEYDLLSRRLVISLLVNPPPLFSVVLVNPHPFCVRMICWKLGFLILHHPHPPDWIPTRILSLIITHPTPNQSRCQFNWSVRFHLISQLATGRRGEFRRGQVVPANTNPKVIIYRLDSH